MVTIDRIEIDGRKYTTPRGRNNHHRADFDRESEPVRFSLLEPLNVAYYHAYGVDAVVVAQLAAEIVGPGFFGLKSYRAES